jgi:hypothetical protein
VPQGNKKALMIVGAFALIAIEAFLNMTFFAKGRRNINFTDFHRLGAMV